MSSINEKMTAIADAIREKTGGTEPLTLDDMAVAIQNISITLQDKTIMPSATEQVITADNGYDGLDTVTVNGDTNLKAENIAEGISIFGVEGTYSGEGSGGENIETCTVIINRNTYCYGWYTQYINNEKITTKFLGGTSSLNIENVLCNSSIVICDMGGEVASPSINGDASLVCELEFLMDYSTKPFIIMCGKGIIEITTNIA